MSNDVTMIVEGLSKLTAPDAVLVESAEGVDILIYTRSGMKCLGEVVGGIDVPGDDLERRSAEE